MKVGDKVLIDLKTEIGKATKKSVSPSVLELWKGISGKIGVITDIISDDEIWVVGDNTGVKRMFNIHTLKMEKE